MSNEFKDRNRDRGFKFHVDFPPFNFLWKNICDSGHPFFHKEHWFDQFRDKFSDGSVRPHTRIESDKNAYMIIIEIPGIFKEDIDLEISSEELWLQAKNERYDKNYRLHLLFRKSIKSDQIKANLKAGILTITAPFSDKEPKTKVKID
ncbi:MAG: Hsp20/alpha crystallin family protein [Candidatus Hodarchaeota archaeon]